MEIILIKQDDNTFKAHGSDYDKIKKLKRGTEYKCEITRPRNFKMLKKFNILINLVFDNQEHYINREHLRHDLIIASGYYNMRKNFKGELIYEPQSVSFSSMDQDTFEELYDRVLDTIEKYFQFDSELVRNEINRF